MGACRVDFRLVSAFCVEIEGKAPFSRVAEEEEIANNSGEEGRILVSKVMSSVFSSWDCRLQSSSSWYVWLRN